MKNAMALLMVAFVLSSCAQQVSVDLNYASTNLGYLNSGGHTSGSLLLWDRRKSTVTALENVACLRRIATNPNPTRIETSYDFSLKGGGELTPAELAFVRASIERRTSLVADDVRRFQCTSIVTSLTNYINSDPTVLSDWYFQDVLANPDLLYVFVTDVAIGDSIEVKVDNKSGATAGLPLKLGASKINVEIDRSSLQKLSGDDVVLMFNARFLRPTYVTNEEGGKNASFELLRDVDFSALQAALKNGR